jgi:hypothetical protein
LFATGNKELKSMKILFGGIIFLAFVTGGCDSQYDPVVDVRLTPPNFQIKNLTIEPLFFLAIETDLLARINMADPCDNFKPNLSPYEMKEIPIKEVYGVDEQSTSITVIWTDCKSPVNSKRLMIN